MATGLRNEDYGTRTNLSEQQEVYYDFYQQLVPVRAGKIRRNLLTMAITPRINRLDPHDPGSRRVTIDQDHLIIDMFDVNFWFMWDRPVRGRQRDRRVESVITGEVGFADKQCDIYIGGDPYRHHTFIRFDEPPFKPYQEEAADTYGKNKLLLSPRGGPFCVRRFGPYVDLLLENEGRHYVVYRLSAVSLEQGHIGLPLVEALPAGPEIVAVCDVLAGEPLASIGDHDVYFTMALFPSEGWPRISESVGARLCDTRAEFRMFNLMNAYMTELTRLGDDEVRCPVDPNQWRLGAFFEFESIQQIVQHAEFSCSPALQQDLQAALGPRGLNRGSSVRVPGAGHREFLQIRAEYAGRVEAHEYGNYVKLVYDGGDVQLVPACAELRLPEDQVVCKNDSIGDFCSRGVYTWPQLEEVFGTTLPFVVESFLMEWSIKPGEFGWQGKNFLVDHRYTRSIAASIGQRRNDRLVCKVDLRAAAGWLEPEIGGMVLPPMRYPDWNEPHVDLWGIQLFLGTPAEREKAYRETRSRRRKDSARSRVGSGLK